MIKQLVSVIATFALTQSVYAATATPSSQKLEDLKDRLASAASQLSQSQKRAVAGIVKTTSVSTITIETTGKDVKIELTDAVKVIKPRSGKRTTITTDDLQKGDTVTVFGDYDTTLDLLKAKLIIVQDVAPERMHGIIQSIDKKNYTITIETPEGTSMIVDIETTTKHAIWDKTSGSAKGSFSKYAVGDSVFVLDTPEPKFANRVSALRILNIGNPSGATPTPTPTPTKSASPSAATK